MKYKSSYFSSQDKFKLFEQSWFPETKPRAVIILVHGIGEHSSRYDETAKYFTEHNYGVSTFDLRGHGKSDGIRAYIDSFDQYIDDLEDFIVEIKKRNPDLPVYIYGHSMGGTIVVSYGLKQNTSISGIILSAAALKISNDISPLLIKLATFISKFFPRMKTIKLDTSGLSRIKEIEEKYNNDPLAYHDGIPARTGAELSNKTLFIAKNAEYFNYPVLIFHGDKDKLSNCNGSKEFFSKISSADKTLKIYENFYHECHNDIDKEIVLKDILNWLNSRT